MKRIHLGFLMCAVVAFAGVEGCAWDVTPQPVYDVEAAEAGEVEETGPIAEEESPPREESAPTVLGENKEKMPDDSAPPVPAVDPSQAVNPHQNFARPAEHATMVDFQDL